MKPKITIILNKKVSEVSDSCPTATVDIEENSKNRNWTIAVSYTHLTLPTKRIV